MIESGFYATETGELLAVFGGRIGVQAVALEENNEMVYEVALTELPEKHEIGEDLDGPKTLEEYNKFSPVRLRFYDTRSIDVLINKLQEIKRIRYDGENFSKEK